MFNFLKKDNFNFIDELKVDMHSHLLPAIDDGAKSIDESIELIKKLKELGYKKLITTPHIIEDRYPNKKEIILEKLKTLKEALQKENIKIEIEAAAEHYLDESFLDKLEKNEVLSFGDNYLLFETSYISKPLNLNDIIYEIKLKGYKAVFAHPERYRYIQDLKKEYKELKESEVLFQININSLSGYYGKDAKKKAEFLIENSMIDFLGSDTHHLKHISALESIKSNKKFWNKIISKNKILNKTLL